MGLVKFLVSRALIERAFELPGTCRIMEINPTTNDEYEFVVEDIMLPDNPEPILVQPTIHKIIWDWNLGNDDTLGQPYLKKLMDYLEKNNKKPKF